MRNRKSGKISTLTQILLFLTVFGILAASVWAYGYYVKMFAPNVTVQDEEPYYLYIPTGSGYTDLIKNLDSNNVLTNLEYFIWTAEKMKFGSSIKAGRFKISNKMSNRELINLLRSGKQEPLNITFQNIRLKETLAGLVARRLEFDSASLSSLLNDERFTEKYGFTPITVKSVFIPNTYQYYWNTSAEEFFERQYREYQKFWNEERKEKAQNIGLTPIQVSILASIVDQETNMVDEMPTVAGVYMNRLKRGQKLEADPTVIFAFGDFTVRRVRGNAMLNNPSPYNTYRHTGLPPGPICIPGPKEIDAVLNYEKHDYIYFCAKDDFSGYHAFAVTYSQHLQNARRFQKALNERNIIR